MDKKYPNPNVWIRVKYRPLLAKERNVSELINELLEVHYFGKK